jgi:histidinol-phosphate aminotransferase
MAASRSRDRTTVTRTKNPALTFFRPSFHDTSGFSVATDSCPVKLDQNESPYAVPSELKAEIVRLLASEPWQRYVQPTRYEAAKRAFAAVIGVAAEQLILCAGCDQLIQLVLLAAGGPGRRIQVFEPTYPLYAHWARLSESDLVQTDLGPDYALEEKLLDPRAQLIAIARPNNPTGTLVDQRVIEHALKQDALVFVDEAYQDFSGESVVSGLERDENLIIGRSLSKGLLAGIRLGYGLAHPEVIDVLERAIFAPYHLSTLQILLIEQFARLKPALDRYGRKIIEDRERLQHGLKALGLRTWPSRANFVLFAVADVQESYHGLLRRGIRVRNVTGMPGLSSHLRVTVGTQEENRLFLAALAEVLRSIAAE